MTQLSSFSEPDDSFKLPLISCVMPTYGRPAFVDESVCMFLAQDYPRKELIIFNDCAGQVFHFEHPQVRIVNCDSRYATLGEKRNAVIELARGELIAVWDDDDAYLPWRLSFSYSEMQRLHTPFYRAATFLAYWGDLNLHDNQSVPGWVNHPNTLFTKAIWAEVGGYPPKGVGEDEEFFARVHKHLQTEFIKYPINDFDRFFILRGKSHYAHMSMNGGLNPLDTAPVRHVISPQPIRDPVFREAYDQRISQRANAHRHKMIGKPLLSVCVSVKNRSRVEAAGRTLELFPRCVESIANAADELGKGTVELVVADFNSRDWHLSDWITSAARQLPVKVVNVEGDFSRGRGLNIAVTHARSDVLFLCDADICVNADVLRRGMAEVSKGHAWFPICQYLDLDGNPANWEELGFGLAFLCRDHFERAKGVPEFRSWGGEDELFHSNVSLMAPIVRNRAPGLFHQWHPEHVRHENYARPARADFREYPELATRQQTVSEVSRRFICSHPHWTGELHLFADGRLIRPGSDTGTYIFTELERIDLYWDKWPSEHLHWNALENQYRANDKHFTMTEIKS